MKAVFPTCYGIDVRKSFLVATIIKTPTDNLQPEYQKKRFSVFNSELNRLADWLYENGWDVCMESTGKYWGPVFNILENRGIRVVIANPKRVKAVKGNKDDTKDSKWIGDLFRIGLVKSSEKNSFQNAFTVCNVALDSVVSDIFGKFATTITVISEISVDMAQFGSSKRLCCWAGLTPGNNESAGKKKSVRISRAGVYLKPALVKSPTQP